MKNSVSNLNLPSRHTVQDERVHQRKFTVEPHINNICISGPIDYQETYYEEAAENSFYDQRVSSGSRIENGEKLKQRR